ncbi:MAG: sulfatase-like hydrolase/transferase [Planctomycetota bacterium]
MCNIRTSIGLAIAIASCVSFAVLEARSAEADATTKSGRPNIVFILADDLGYGDLGCYGREDIRTPNLDRLAQQGVRFTQYYANGPECTPTRTALLTGRYQQRVGGLECAIGVGGVGRYDDAIRLDEQDELGLPASETSLGQILKAAGYATAITGKWHLGYEDKFAPSRHGFDEAFYIVGGSADYFHHTEPDGTHMLRRNGAPERREGYITNLISDEAVAFVERAGDKPFFLYVPYTAPHSPFQGPNDRQEQPLSPDSPLNDQGKSPLPVYRAMIECMDQGIGRILEQLNKDKVADHTLVIFASDNGGTRSGRNAPLSGQKGQTFEGGIRVPAIARWPGVLPAGVTYDQPCATFDLTCSMARAAGAKLPAGRSFDGIDILSYVEKEQAPPARMLFWRKLRGDQTWWGVRDGKWKYVRRQEGDKQQEHLFDLEADIAEENDLLAENPQVASRLREALSAWEEEVRPVR